MKELIVSTSLHLFLFGIGVFSFGFTSEQTNLPIFLIKGSANQSIFFFKNQGLGNDPSQTQSPRSESAEGSNSLEREVAEFYKKLTYPSIAIEQGLEDNCSFLFSVMEDGRVERVNEVVPCRYQIFSDQVRSQAKTWRFGHTKGQEVLVPVTFRIHEKD